MTAEKAIECLYEMKYRDTSDSDNYKACEMAIGVFREIEQIRWERDMAMEQLKANGLRFAHKDDYGWIPCSERLPEESNTYLVTQVHAYCDNDGYVSVIPMHYDTEIEWYTKSTYYKVVAWCPLPEPYKEKKDEAD